MAWPCCNLQLPRVENGPVKNADGNLRGSRTVQPGVLGSGLDDASFGFMDSPWFIPKKHTTLVWLSKITRMSQEDSKRLVSEL